MEPIIKEEKERNSKSDKNEKQNLFERGEDVDI